MIRGGILLSLALLTQSAEAQIVGSGDRTVVAKPAPARIGRDRGANVRSPRRLRNPFFAARPLYPPVERGTPARINFEPFTSKYYPRVNDLGSNSTTSPLIRGR